MSQSAAVAGGLVGVTVAGGAGVAGVVVELALGAGCVGVVSLEGLGLPVGSGTESVLPEQARRAKASEAKAKEVFMGARRLHAVCLM